MDTHSLSSASPSRPASPSRSPSQDVTRAMIERARMLINQFIRERGHAEPPFLARELAPLQGIKQIIKTDLGEVDALLLRTADGYVIKINENHVPERQNFSCAHEIGHTFLHELDMQSSTGAAEFRMLTSDMTAKDKERLCNVVAAELLMPESVFRKYLSRFGVSITSVAKLADIFRVSPPAAAIRIAEVGIEPCIAISWKPWQKTKSKGFIAKHMGKPIYVRDPSAMLKAYETDSAVKSFKSFDIGNIRKRCLMESKGFGRGKTRYVISLVFPDR